MANATVMLIQYYDMAPVYPYFWCWQDSQKLLYLYLPVVVLLLGKQKAADAPVATSKPELLTA